MTGATCLLNKSRLRKPLADLILILIVRERAQGSIWAFWEDLRVIGRCSLEPDERTNPESIKSERHWTGSRSLCIETDLCLQLSMSFSICSALCGILSPLHLSIDAGLSSTEF